MSQGRYVVVRRTDGRAVAADYRRLAERADGDEKARLLRLAATYEHAGTTEEVVASTGSLTGAMADVHARNKVTQTGVRYYAKEMR